MKFTHGTLLVAGEEAIKLNEVSVKKQKELIKKYPFLEKLVINENNNERSSDDVEVQPQPKRSRKRRSEPKS